MSSTDEPISRVEKRRTDVPPLSEGDPARADRDDLDSDHDRDEPGPLRRVADKLLGDHGSGGDRDDRDDRDDVARRDPDRRDPDRHDPDRHDPDRRDPDRHEDRRRPPADPDVVAPDERDRRRRGSDRPGTLSEEPVRPAPAAVRPGEGELATLIPRARSEAYRNRWDGLKAAFVDEPRSAVRGADELVGQVLDELEGLFRRQRDELERDLHDDQATTEDLRVALSRYRSFFERLLSL